MRKIDFKKIGLAAMMLLSALTFQSCDNDNDTDWDRVFPNALVTVKRVAMPAICSSTTTPRCSPRT